jgi:hypothetical protein
VRCRSPPRGSATCSTPWSAATGCWGRTTRPGGRRVPAPGPGPDRRARQQARQHPGSGGGGRHGGLLPHRQAPPAGVCGGVVAAAVVRGVRSAHPARPGQPLLYDVSTLYLETDAGTGAASQGSPRSGGWSRRSRSACSPARTGSRSWSPPLRATRLRRFCLPQTRTVHPFSQARFAATHPRWEPSAVVPHAGICAEGRSQGQFPPDSIWDTGGLLVTAQFAA